MLAHIFRTMHFTTKSRNDDFDLFPSFDVTRRGKRLAILEEKRETAACTLAYDLSSGSCCIQRRVTKILSSLCMGGGREGRRMGACVRGEEDNIFVLYVLYVHRRAHTSASPQHSQVANRPLRAEAFDGIRLRSAFEGILDQKCPPPSRNIVDLPSTFPSFTPPELVPPRDDPSPSSSASPTGESGEFSTGFS